MAIQSFILIEQHTGPRSLHTVLGRKAKKADISQEWLRRRGDKQEGQRQRGEENKGVLHH